MVRYGLSLSHYPKWHISGLVSSEHLVSNRDSHHNKTQPKATHIF